MEEIPVKEMVDSELRKLGFKRKGITWYRNHDEVLHVIELRKSRWGQYYSIWLAVWVQALEHAEFPKLHHCPLQDAIDHVPDAPPDIDAALNEEEYWKSAMVGNGNHWEIAKVFLPAVTGVSLNSGRETDPLGEASDDGQ
jgi:hypothetical protein